MMEDEGTAFLSDAAPPDKANARQNEVNSSTGKTIALLSGTNGETSILGIRIDRGIINDFDSVGNGSNNDIVEMSIDANHNDNNFVVNGIFDNVIYGMNNNAVNESGNENLSTNAARNNEVANMVNNDVVGVVGVEGNWSRRQLKTAREEEEEQEAEEAEEQEKRGGDGGKIKADGSGKGSELCFMETSIEGKPLNSSQTSNGSESKTEAIISNLLEKLHSSQEERSTSPCSACGRRHHSSRMPWTQSMSCNPVIGLDVDDDDFQNAQDDDDAEPHLIYIPLIFDNLHLNNLLIFAMNLTFAMAVGIYFDEKFLRLIHEHHHDLFPPPFSLQMLHFFAVVFLSFASMQRFWRTVLLDVN